MNREAFLYAAASLAAAPIPGMGIGIDPVGSVESRYPGLRLGVFAIDTRDGTTMQRRPDESFPLASTVKVPVVMTMLHRIDQGAERLDRPVRVEKADLNTSYSEIARLHPNGGTLTLEQICAYTISDSDNTGVDVLFKMLGGPRSVDAYAASIGMRGISIDRIERQLPNAADVSERRDTVTPRAMATLMQRLAARSPLSPRSTALLLQWMRATTTGGGRLRAGVPAGWHVADKTGTYHNAANDAGLLYRPDGTAIAVAVYAFGLPQQTGSRAIADVARAVTGRLG